jgi:concentrative nucleoside transporter, CNT family
VEHDFLELGYLVFGAWCLEFVFRVWFLLFAFLLSVPMHLKLISLLGMCVLIGVAWAFSVNRKRFPWRTVGWGLGLQFIFAVLILKTAPGRKTFEVANAAVNRLIGFANEGSKMVFGPLADAQALKGPFPENAFIFAITVTATIILVAALSSLLYHWGVLQKVVHAMAWVMQRAMKTSGSETLAAAANIFMGQTEAPLVIKPYLARMTQSELLCLMTGGMATIAGGVAAAYAQMGNAAGHPETAGHLLSASVMSAPAALMIAKVIMPETEQSETASGRLVDPERNSLNSIDALCRGTSDGLQLAVNVIAMLIAFVAVVALANFLITWPQQAAFEKWNIAAEPMTLQKLAGWINAPFAWLLGVPAKDCVAIGQVLGERIVLNEFIGYLSLTNPKTVVEPRSFVLATYALCGFANFSSIAIQIGGIGALAPNRRGDLARLGLRAMFGGLLASYLTATVVGILI